MTRTQDIAIASPCRSGKSMDGFYFSEILEITCRASEVSVRSKQTIKSLPGAQQFASTHSPEQREITSFPK
jgi:hypothetical protein